MVFICIPSNNLNLVCVWAQVSTWIRGKKVFLFWRRSFFVFLVFTWIRGKKVFRFWWRLFFWSSLKLLSWKKSWSRYIPPYVENWGKIANYLPLPNTQQWFAPLASRTPFEALGLGLEAQVLGIGLEAYKSSKMPRPRLGTVLFFDWRKRKITKQN